MKELRTIDHIKFYTGKVTKYALNYEPRADKRGRRYSRLLLLKKLLENRIMEQSEEAKKRIDQERGMTK